MPKIDIDLKINVDSGELESTQEILKEIGDNTTKDVDIHADDSEVKTAKKELDDLEGETVNTNVSVDDTEIKNAKKELEDLQKQITTNMNSTSNAVNGVISGLAGKSIWDTIYGTSAKAETNKVLIKNMGDVETSSEKLYNTIDKTTDSSLISMQQLIPALNGIKSATGATATEINSASDKVASFGQYVYAMTGSEAKAEQAMFDLSKGIKGAYASLDQYGITEDALMRTKLWSGKEDDLEGYLAAVNEVTGSTDDLMNTATGMEALMGKSFSRAGKRLGETVLPAVKDLLNGFNELDSATNGWLATSMLVGGGVASSLVSGLSALNQAKQGYDALKGSIETVHGAVDSVRGAIDTLKNAESIAAGITEVLTGAKTLEAAAEEGSMLAKIASIGPTVTLAGAEMGLLLPLLLITGAIIAVVGALWYLYNNNETVRASIDALRDGLMNLVGQFAAFVDGVWSYLTGLWDNLVNWFNQLQTMTPAQIVMLIAKVISTLNPLSGLVNGVLSKVLPVFITNATSWITNTVNKARTLVSNVHSAVSQLPSKVSSALSGVTSAFTKPFQNAWNTISGIVNKVKDSIGTITSALGFAGADFSGVDYSGFSTGTLNTTLTNTLTSTNGKVGGVTNNFNINGIIEEEASQYIVDSVNNHIKKQNLKRGV